MILIFGGAYQGKLDYAKQRFASGENEIIDGFDKWILELVKIGADIAEEVRKFIETHPDAVVICDDISCGVVPLDSIMRKWREAVGRSLAALSQKSEEVIRLFCGIPTRIK
ncbi:MAG: bifunctional adenosylcobinamide kinase/adenosylcobinamide-phosphate guanylyltransferase [Oscillospiraceae bacterium]|nr:bifunctional adenosylcobinamide kinase/adenosylcobinamide-phosphate guanylyltransferase [Oscillospiraceae bacterium]